MHEYLVERYEPGIGEERLKADARRLAQVVAAMRRDGAAIEFLSLTFLPADEGAFSWLTSASEELVTTAFERADIPFERIVEAVPVEVLEEVE